MLVFVAEFKVSLRPLLVNLCITFWKLKLDAVSFQSSYNEHFNEELGKAWFDARLTINEGIKEEFCEKPDRNNRITS